MDIGVQHGHVQYVQHGHGHGHAAWTRTCSMDKDMQHGPGMNHVHVYAALTLTCSMAVDMYVHAA
jgi:hypothetical protein